MRHPDDPVLERVRALLAKAESTTFPDEAEAFTAKAQELMARHAIDAALLGDDPAAVPHVSHREVEVDAPYRSAKVSVLAAAASANRCRVVWSPDTGRGHLFGVEGDVAAVEVLYTSLLVQATGAMLAEGPRRDRRGRSRTRSFRHAFILAFAARVGERLRAATDDAVAAHEQRAALVPVLAERAEAVDRAMADAFPDAGRQRVTVTNGEGVAAGRAAADRADLDLRAAAGPGGRRAIR